TRQPKSGFVSNHDSCSWSSAGWPTTASTGDTGESPSTAAAWSRVVVEVRCAVVAPCVVTATGVSARRPASSSRSSASDTSSGSPRTTTVTSSPTDRLQSTLLSCAEMTWTARDAAVVSGTPAYAGTALTADTPGTTSKGSPALRQ